MLAMDTKRQAPRIILLLLTAFTAMIIAVLVILLSTSRVRIVQTWPADASHDVPITTPIRITFSQPMDAASVEANLRVDPKVEGTLSWEGEELRFQPRVALAPGAVYSVTLAAGSHDESGRVIDETYAWSFQTRQPQLLFLGRSRPDADVRQLYVVSASGVPRQMTHHQGGVWDYTIHPLGEGIIYSVLREEGGSDLWRMNHDGTEKRRLLACHGAACLAPAWSPDGGLLAYERRDIRNGAPNLDPQAGRIWLLDLERSNERSLFDYDVALHSPVWAPEGERLAYVSPLIPGIEILDLKTGALQQFGNEWGASPEWAPDGQHLVLPELLLAGEDLVVHLLRVDLDEEGLVDIRGAEAMVKDAGPAWSPGGGWIAFGRQLLDQEKWTPGRLIWLTRPDGSEAYALPTESPMSDDFSLAWRPDGGALAHARADLSSGPQLVPDVSIWIFDFDQGASRFIAPDGVRPQWLP